MSSEQIEAAGVALGFVTVAGELDYVQIFPTAFSATIFGKPLLFRGDGTADSDPDNEGTGMQDLFCVPPDPEAFIVPEDPDPAVIPAGRTRC